MHGPVPVALRVLVEWGEHDRQDNVDIVADEIAEILVVPEVECSFSHLWNLSEDHLRAHGFSYLEVRACDRLSELIEEWLLYFSELGRIHYFKDVLDLVEEHHLFGTVDLGPVAQQTKHNLLKSAQSRYGRKRARTTSSVNAASFSRNCTMQYASWGWYMLSPLTLCIGISTRVRKSLCSSFKGSANPLMMEPRISSNSAIPLNLSVS